VKSIPITSNKSVMLSMRESPSKAMRCVSPCKSSEANSRLHQATEQQRIAAARLAQVLHLDPSIELVALDADLAPLALIETNAALDSFVQRSLTQRPELNKNQALLRASREANNGAVYGPFIPTVGAQGFFGGLGGGRSGVGDTFGAQEDYAIGVSWRIGPGGLFDLPERARLNRESKFPSSPLGSFMTMSRAKWSRRSHIGNR